MEKAPKRINPEQSSDHLEEKGTVGCGCPGSMAKQIKRETTTTLNQQNKPNVLQEPMLQNWPVQLQLAPTQAAYFDGAHLLIAADCTAYAYPNMHQEFIAGRIALIGCPKLDDNNYYAEKLAHILGSNNIKSITVLRMEVPCCAGIVSSVKKAMLQSETIIPYNEVTISLAGEIK